MSFSVSRSESSHGFTLLEILAVLIVLAVLTVTVLVSQTRSNAGVVGEAAQLAAHFRYTQMRALGDVTPWSLKISAGTSYQIARTGDAAVRIPGSSDTLRKFPGSISATNSPTEIRFDPWGRPVSSTNAPVSSDIFLTLTDGTHQVSITISAQTGLIR